jgi:FkbM family methyltransferase
MNDKERAKLKAKIIKRYGLYKLQYSRLKRLVKDPFRTLPYYALQAIAYQYPFKVRKKTLWGVPMTYYLPEGNAIYYYGFFEANLTNFFINFLQEGDVFFDVGAHVGYYTMLARELVGETGSVHSFEPTPRTFRSLVENIREFKNVSANNAAVFNEETEIEFADYGPKYSAFNSYKERTGESMKFLGKPEIVSAKTVSLDNYCRERSLQPTVVKIDAEGAEHMILQAMTRIIADIKPIITIEVAGGEEWKDNCARSIAILRSNGYECFEATLEGQLKTHHPQATYSYENLIFVHAEKLSLIQSLRLS